MIQINILKEILKKNIFIIISYFLFLIIQIIILQNTIEINPNTVLELLCLPNTKINLYTLYKFIIVIYLAYKYYTYEFKNSFEFIFTRIPAQKWYLSKLLPFAIILWLLDTYNFIMLLFAFNHKVDLSLTTFLSTFLLDILISLTLITMTSIMKNRESVLIVTLLISIAYFYNFNFITSIIFIVLFILLTYVLFKKYKLIETIQANVE